MGSGTAWQERSRLSFSAARSGSAQRGEDALAPLPTKARPLSCPIGAAPRRVREPLRRAGRARSWRSPALGWSFRGQERKHVAGDHEILIRRDDQNGDAAACGGDARGVCVVELAVDDDSKIGAAGADGFSDRRRMLADASGENELIETAQHGYQRTDVFDGDIHV